PARLSQGTLRRDGRRARLQSRDRDALARADRGDPDVCRTASRDRTGRSQTLPARSLPCTGDDDRKCASILSSVVPGRSMKTMLRLLWVAARTEGMTINFVIPAKAGIHVAVPESQNGSPLKLALECLNRGRGRRAEGARC